MTNKDVIALCESSKYSPICISKEMDDFIKKCESTVMEYNLENKRIRTVEDIINK